MRAGGGTDAGDDWGLVAGRGEVVEQGSHMFGVEDGRLRSLLVRMNCVVEDGWFWIWLDCGWCLYEEDNDKVEVWTIFIVPDGGSGRSSINLGMFQDWQVGTAGFKIASPRFKMLMFSSHGSLLGNFIRTDTHWRRVQNKLLVEVPKILVGRER